jgi:hypothetical protein
MAEEKIVIDKTTEAEIMEWFGKPPEKDVRDKEEANKVFGESPVKTQKELFKAKTQ